MDTLTFNSNTYSGTYTPGNNGVPCTFTVVVGTLSPTVGDNLTLARINNRNVYIPERNIIKALLYPRCQRY